MERSDNETKLETIDQLAIGVRVSFLAVCNNIGIVIQLSEKIDFSNNPWFQLVRIIGVPLYSHFSQLLKKLPFQ